MAHRSVTRQTLHYFARRHTHVADRPVSDRAAWTPGSLGAWRETFDDAEVAELDGAVEVARRTGKPLYALQTSDFPLPTLAARIAGWRDQLAEGRGFVVVSGVPVDRWEEDDCERFFWLLGRYLGTPGAQNPAGDLLGHVRDQGFSSQESVRAYRTNTEIKFHCDAADVVGLLCRTQAQSGGRSRIASSVSVFNALVERRPDLAPLLFEPFALDTKAEGGVRYFLVPPCRFEGGKLRTFYHADYFRSASRYSDVAALPPARVELLDLYDQIANELCLSMQLDPGDVQLLNNHTQVHAREKYIDGPDKRHLLRLWLSLKSGGGGNRRAWASLVGRFAWSRFTQPLRA